MKLKLFGKDIFEFRGKNALLFESSSQQMKKEEYLPDFYEGMGENPDFERFVVMEDTTAPGRGVAVPIKKKKKEKGLGYKITPKGVYEFKYLDKEGFEVNTNKKFIDEQIEQFKDKLNLINVKEFDMARGVREISSILIRLENRKKYAEFKKFYEEFPYTVTSKIDEVIKIHKHLHLGKVHQFMADMPKEAVKVMKDYTSNTKKLCTKKPLFYVIADKKDFQKTNKRKDPILLAQSPFGHSWQILGAWDEEVLFLEEL